MYKHETEKPWKCDECDYVHASKHALLCHKRIVHPKIGDLKLCHICDYKTVTNQNLNHHIELKHGTNTKYPCNICNEIQSTQRYLVRHIKGLYNNVAELKNALKTR